MGCSKCGGTGRLICQNCNGTGTITISSYGIDGSQVLSFSCSACVGTGFQKCTCGSSLSGDAAFEGQQLVHNEIVPFEHINGIVPGVTTFIEVAKFFGAPDHPLDYADRGMTWYKGLGFSIKVEDYRVVSITAFDNYRGRAPNGLHTGLDVSTAKMICDAEYKGKNKKSDKMWTYRHPNSIFRFMIANANGKLTGMTLE